MNRAYPLTVYYDGACPVCAFEIGHLRERSRDGRLVFVDISAPGFDAPRHGATPSVMNAEIHGLRADGTMVRGVEVLRLAYEGAGLGFLLRPTGWSLLRPLADAAYRTFARHRLAISRTAAPLIALVRALRARNRLVRALQARNRAGRMRACGTRACGAPPRQADRCGSKR